jgi:hypothetical protein
MAADDWRSIPGIFLSENPMLTGERFSPIIGNVLTDFALGGRPNPSRVLTDDKHRCILFLRHCKYYSDEATMLL